MKEERTGGRKGKEDRIRRGACGEVTGRTRNTGVKITKEPNFHTSKNCPCFPYIRSFIESKNQRKKKNRSRFAATEDEAIMDDVSVLSRSSLCRFWWSCSSSAAKTFNRERWNDRLSLLLTFPQTLYVLFLFQVVRD